MNEFTTTKTVSQVGFYYEGGSISSQPDGETGKKLTTSQEN